MNSSIIATFLIITSLLLILASLVFGLFYLLLDQHQSKRIVTALSIRITLSMLLFGAIALSVYLGLIIPAPPPL